MSWPWSSRGQGCTRCSSMMSWMASPSSGCAALAFFHQRGKVLGGAFGGAAAGCALYMKKETFGKGTLRLCPIFVIVRRGAVVIRTWRVPWGRRPSSEGNDCRRRASLQRGFLQISSGDERLVLLGGMSGATTIRPMVRGQSWTPADGPWYPCTHWSNSSL